jgi:SLT domain-containing protein
VSQLQDAGNAPAVVRQAMEIAGVSPDWEPYMAILMQAESSGNPVAQNPLWVEYRTGKTSRTYPGPGWHRATGLFQLMQPTFDAHKVSGYDDIWNPLDNTLAAISYIRGKYKHPARIPGLGQEGYKGY